MIVVWVEDNGKANIHVRDITIYSHCDESHGVHYYYDYYDSLQYPRLFPYGKYDWGEGIKCLEAYT